MLVWILNKFKELLNSEEFKFTQNKFKLKITHQELNQNR